MNATDWSLGYLQWRILRKPTKRLSSVVISNFPFLFCFIYFLLVLSTEFLYKNTITSAPTSHPSHLTLSLPHQSSFLFNVSLYNAFHFSRYLPITRYPSCPRYSLHPHSTSATLETAVASSYPSEFTGEQNCSERI